MPYGIAFLFIDIGIARFFQQVSEGNLRRGHMYPTILDKAQAFTL